MLEFLKRKKRQSDLSLVLKLVDREFASIVKGVVDESHPAALTMLLVALHNLSPMLSACQKLSKTESGHQVPADLDGFIRMIANRLEEDLDEIPKRRLMWFYQAALVQRLDAVAEDQPNLHSNAAAIWIQLTKGAANICHLLPPSALWSEDEKAYFVDIKNERDGIWYCLQIMTPAYLRSNSELISFAESQGVLLLPKR